MRVIGLHLLVPVRRATLLARDLAAMDKPYPRLQLRTIGEILAGKRFYKPIVRCVTKRIGDRECDRYSHKSTPYSLCF